MVELRSDLARVDGYVNTAADYDEIPDMAGRIDGGVLQSAGVPKTGRPSIGERARQQVTLRLDPKIIEHFKRAGPGWQSRINDVLGRAVDAPDVRSSSPVSVKASLASDAIKDHVEKVLAVLHQSQRSLEALSQMEVRPSRAAGAGRLRTKLPRITSGD